MPHCIAWALLRLCSAHPRRGRAAKGARAERIAIAHDSVTYVVKRQLGNPHNALTCLHMAWTCSYMLCTCVYMLLHAFTCSYMHLHAIRMHLHAFACISMHFHAFPVFWCILFVDMLCILLMVSLCIYFTLYLCLSFSLPFGWVTSALNKAHTYMCVSLWWAI